MNRRDFLKVLGLGTAALVLPAKIPALRALDPVEEVASDTALATPIKITALSAASFATSRDWSQFIGSKTYSGYLDEAGVHRFIDGKEIIE